MDDPALRAAWEHLPATPSSSEFYERLALFFTLGCRPEAPSLYLLGSQLDGTAIATSDVDLAMVFASRVNSALRQRIVALRSAAQVKIALFWIAPYLAKARYEEA